VPNDVLERVLDVVEALSDKFDALVARVEAEQAQRARDSERIDSGDMRGWN
jgi:hypothetical protein